jgi:hypothetical protein
MTKNSKRYEIQQRVNPRDKWKKYKRFDDLKKARESFNMCIKHTCNLFKDSMYYKYRLIDRVTNKILDDTSDDTHIFFY